MNCEPSSFVEGGFAQRVTTSKGSSHVVQDSPVVCFAVELTDSEGCMHCPIMLASFTVGYFPPNTYFTLKDVRDGFEAPNGVWVRRQLLVVSATYHPFSFGL